MIELKMLAVNTRLPKAAGKNYLIYFSFNFHLTSALPLR